MMLLEDDYQAKLFPYAYNILGSIEDAKDVVQDIVVQQVNEESVNIEKPMAYMVKSVINRSINLKKRNKKLTDDTTWLPEPVSTDSADSLVNRDEIISYSLLVILEKLTAKERAVFMLKEGFDYSHEEISQVIEISIENSRKLLSRAKQKVQGKSVKELHSNSKRESSFFKNYVEILKNRDISSLEKLLSEDIALRADGDGKIKVVKDLSIGKASTLDLLIYVYHTYQISHEVELRHINHQPALLFFQNGKPVNCQVFELMNNTITNIYSVVNPDKLRHL